MVFYLSAKTRSFSVHISQPISILLSEVLNGDSGLKGRVSHNYFQESIDYLNLDQIETVMGDGKKNKKDKVSLFNVSKSAILRPDLCYTFLVLQ